MSDHGDLGNALERLRVESDELLREQWDRSLSFADTLFDRWERANRLGFGLGASIYDSAAVFGVVAVGAETWIGPHAVLDGSGGGLVIGSWCAISAGVQIYTHDTVRRSLSMGVVDRETGAVEIGDGCHIGGLSVVAPGTTIGRQCVVGANSFVNRDLPDRTVVGGTPARVLGHVIGDGADVRIETERKA